MNQPQTKKQLKRMLLYCEPCGHRRIIETEEMIIEHNEERLSTVQLRIPQLDPVENKTSPVQLRIPQLDPVTQKTIASKFQPQPKRYKCPCCGRATKLRELLKPYADALLARDEQDRKLKEEEEKRKRLADGKPIEKKTDPDFMG